MACEDFANAEFKTEDELHLWCYHQSLPAISRGKQITGYIFVTVIISTAVTVINIHIKDGNLITRRTRLAKSHPNGSRTNLTHIHQLSFRVRAPMIPRSCMHNTVTTQNKVEHVSKDSHITKWHLSIHTLPPHDAKREERENKIGPSGCTPPSHLLVNDGELRTFPTPSAPQRAIAARRLCTKTFFSFVYKCALTVSSLLLETFLNGRSKSS
ncbi:hypothetical protein V8C42DRAFT_19282 [Trichoderma barbatum]